jgi:5-methylcytosine-specific restriction protein A
MLTCLDALVVYGVHRLADGSWAVIAPDVDDPCRPAWHRVATVDPNGGNVAPPRANPHDGRPWRSWYKLAIWLNIRRQQLLREPLCRTCRASGRNAAAHEVDHITPHRGDWNLFITGALQSLCSDCHRDRSRKNLGHDETGTPLDPRHPWHKHG